LLLATVLLPNSVETSPFSAGKTSLSFGLGNTTDSDYFIVSGTIGHFVAQGLELGTSLNQWFGQEPSVTEAQPFVRYVIEIPEGSVHPYIKGTYSHYFVGSGLPDLDLVGGGGGIIYAGIGSAYIQVGAHYSRVLNECTGDCDSVQPEVAILISF
jgi:hypothetical protein